MSTARKAKSQPEKSTESATSKSNAQDRFSQAGQEFSEALARDNQEAWKRYAALNREYQSELAKLQLGVQRGALKAYEEFLETVQPAQGQEGFPKVWTDATEKYQEGLAELQQAAQDRGKELVQKYQDAVVEIQKAHVQGRFNAFGDYKASCKKAWAAVDVNDLSCESLAFIGQSILMGAQWVGGQPTAQSS